MEALQRCRARDCAMGMERTGGGTDWRGGYATSLDYTAGFYPHLSPEYLNFSCAMHGVEPGAVGRRYNYFELGCGRGLTVNLLAASNPQAQFFANDFMPSHAAEAQQLADAGRLGNLRMLEHSFGELADGAVDLPPLDFITMQGVYTWVSASAREQIVRFVRRFLKPGGLVYLAYNAMPGWAASTPVQRLMHACAEWTPGSPLQKLAHAKDLVAQMRASGADYFQGKADLDRRLQQIADLGPAYLTHEYLHEQWEPMYHADVAADLAGAKLDFVGSALLGNLLLEFTPEQQALLEAIPDSGWRETAKDFMLGTAFRQDLFVRGHRPMSPRRRDALLRRFCVVLTVPPETAAARLKHKHPALAQSMGTVLQAMAARAHTVEELRRLPAFSAEEDAVPIILNILLMTQSVSVFLGDNRTDDNAPAHALNRAIAAQSAYGAAYGALASPLTGSGVQAGADELTVYRQLISGGLPAPAAAEPHLHRAPAADDLQAVAQGSLATWKRLKMI
jgi:SAM-dependent methyltransferase